MKKVSLLGSMSWEDPVTYYLIINERIGEKISRINSTDGRLNE